ncbi:MAG: 50S ribosomal protein L25 [Phycisphaerae bacterium]|jgi:large subunit ribosomal protein L25
MEITTINGQRRAPGGRHANQRLRRAGLLPAVIYGHKQPPECVAVSRHELELALAHMSHVVKLAMDGAETHYLLKEVQYDHLQKTPVHVDLMRVDVKERVHVHVPVELRGDAPGIHEGGELVHVITELHVECPLLEIPGVLRARIDHLVIGEAVHVRDLELPPNVKPLHEPEDIVVVCRTKRGISVGEEAPVAAEAAAEPEVIGRVAKPEEAEGEE